MENNINLLNILMEDVKKQSNLYKPGKFWMQASKVIAKKMKNEGIINFRGHSGLVAQGFTANIVEDPSIIWEVGRLKKHLKKIIDIPIIRKLFINDFTQRIDKNYNKANLYENYFLSNNLKEWLGEMKSNYNIPETTVGGLQPNSIVKIDGYEISKFYLENLARIHTFSKEKDLTKIKTVFEIGGGFGANAHLLTSLFPNIKKYIYLDIAPMLYIGTQYLKHFYPQNVKDYVNTRNLKSIYFKDDNELEILCIPPWQIELLSGEVDLIWNACSFQEIPIASLKNYAKHIFRLTEKNSNSGISLVIYPTDSSLTIQSDEILGIFSDKFGFKKCNGEIKTNLNKPFYHFYGKKLDI